MKSMILRRNALGHGIDVGWRFADGNEAREYFWDTVGDPSALHALIVDLREVGEPFVPPTPGEIAAATDDARALARRVLRCEVAIDDALRHVAAWPA
jgi:hypothetical protein